MRRLPLRAIALGFIATAWAGVLVLFPVLAHHVGGLFGTWAKVVLTIAGSVVSVSLLIFSVVAVSDHGFANDVGWPWCAGCWWEYLTPEEDE